MMGIMGVFKCELVVVVWLVWSMVWCETKTVRYSLTPQIERSSAVEDNLRLTTKTYELQVPGSNPIRIIEAEPMWYQQGHDAASEYPTTTEAYYKNYRDSVEHRAMKNQDPLPMRNKHYKIPELFTTQQTKTTINEPFTNKCYGISCGNEAETSTEGKHEFSAQELNRFLDEFAQKVKKTNMENNKKLDKVEIITHSSVSPIDAISNKNDDLSGGEKDKSKSWNMINTKEHNHPYDDRQGWVTLEAVPWSTSKVSKWESNVKPSRWPPVDNVRPNWHGRPDDGYYQDDKPQFDPTYDPRPPKPHYNGVADDKPYYMNNYHQDWTQDLSARPSWNKIVVSRPDYPTTPTWPRPDDSFPHDLRRPIKPTSHKHYEDKDCVVEHGELVTDGKPSNFPISQALTYIPYGEPYRRPTQVVYADLVPGGHPVTHPETGDGQWVLLSTTKGYQYPKNRQRSLKVKPDVLTARRSVRLTVLPALNGSDVNMTTSHGGLLQVDSRFETVDEARKTYIRKLRNSTRRPNRTSVRLPAKPSVAGTPDTTAVLAAVGAGMVPATMAMVMPLVLGRKRRSVNDDRHRDSAGVMLGNAAFTVTQLPNYHLESTLQRSRSL